MHTEAHFGYLALENSSSLSPKVRACESQVCRATRKFSVIGLEHWLHEHSGQFVSEWIDFLDVRLTMKTPRPSGLESWKHKAGACRRPKPKTALDSIANDP